MLNSFHSIFLVEISFFSENVNFGIKCTYDMFVLGDQINYIFISAVVKNVGS